MASRTSGLALNIGAFSGHLLESSEVAPRARIIAQSIADLLPGAAVVCYTFSATPDGEVWTLRAVVGDGVEADAVISASVGTLGIVSRQRTPLIFGARSLVREDYAHLNVRRTLHSLAYVPLLM